jgi:hypothetical protein
MKPKFIYLIPFLGVSFNFSSIAAVARIVARMPGFMVFSFALRPHHQSATRPAL